MIRLPPNSTRTAPLFPYTTLFRSQAAMRCAVSAPDRHYNASSPRKPLPGRDALPSAPGTDLPRRVVPQIGWQYEGAAERVHRHILLDRSHLNAGQMTFLRAHQIQRRLQPRLLAAVPADVQQDRFHGISRSEAHTSELQ